jgi:hypothetical protein
MNDNFWKTNQSMILIFCKSSNQEVISDLCSSKDVILMYTVLS